MKKITEKSTSQLANLNIDGRTWQVHYHDCAADNPKVLVMLHGSGPGANGWSNFNRNIEPMVQAGYRVILPDCLGWGKSDSLVCEGSRSELNARTLKALLDHLGINGKIDLIGNSMGGHSVVAFALAYPQQAGSLILMGGGTGGVSPFAPMPMEGIKLLQQVYREPTMENLQKMMDVFVFDPSGLTPELIASRLENIVRSTEHLENFVKTIETNPRQFPDISSRLGEIKAKTLIIWGRNDRFVPMDTGLRLVAGIANSELHIFNQCGHWVQWEYADRFNRLVLDFISP